MDAWKFHGKGLISTRDESTVIGTFHVDRRHPEPDYVRGLVLRAEALETALRRLDMVTTEHNAISDEYRRTVRTEARELLDELSLIRLSSKK